MRPLTPTLSPDHGKEGRACPVLVAWGTTNKGERMNPTAKAPLIPFGVSSPKLASFQSRFGILYGCPAACCGVVHFAER